MALTDSLYAYWHLNETSGSRLDSSGNSRTMTVTQGAGGMSGVAGQIGNALRLTGNNPYPILTYTTGTSWDNVPFSLMAWHRFDLAGGWTVGLNHGYFHLGNVSFNFSLLNTITATTPNRCTVNYYSGYSTVTPILQEVDGIVTGTWNHIVVTGDGTTANMYINNVLVDTFFDAGGYDEVLGDNVEFFNQNPSNANSVQLWDECAIWSRELTRAEITTLYNGGSNGQTITEIIQALNRRTLVMDESLMEGRAGWFYDQYTPNVNIHYGEEGDTNQAILCGGEDGNLYQLIGDSDNGSNIACQVRTTSEDQGDPRYRKLYGDIMLDANTGGVNITATPGFDNHGTTVAATTVNTTSRSQTIIPFGTSWQSYKNVSLDLSWNYNGARSYLYIWEPRFTEEGAKIAAYSWETDYLTHELHGYFYHGYLYIVHVSTADLTFKIIASDGTEKASVTITNSGGNQQKDFIRLPVVKGTLFKYSISCASEFWVEGPSSELLVKEWGSTEEWKRIQLFSDIPIGTAA